MIVCKIWDSEYPWDVRAEKISRALTDAGHEVHMVARNRDGRPLVESLPECTVHRLAPLPALGRRLNAASMFPAFFNPRWERLVRRVASQTRADVLLVRDLPLAPTAISVGRRLGIPVVLDMAENYPAMMRVIFLNGRQRLTDYVVRNPAIVRRVESWTLERVDHTLVVVEESRDRLVGLGVPAGRITIVGNTPPAARAAEGSVNERPLADGEPLEAIYLGLLEAPRGIGELIDAVHLCRQAGTAVRLTLIGDGRDRELFEAQVRRLGLGDDAVRFLGFVPNTEALALLRSAHVGIIPHHANESWNTTIPNKLFDYMSAGIAVIASDAAPVKRVINETGCGIAFKDRDAADLARALKQMRNNERRVTFAHAGRRAILNRYHWGLDVERLLHTLETIRTPGAMPLREHAPLPSP